MGSVSQIQRKPEKPSAQHHQARPASQSLEFCLVEDAQALIGLEAEWIELEQSAASPYRFFQSHLWVSTWWNHFAGTGKFQLKVLVGRLKGQLMLVWPLVVAKRGLIRRLEPAGGYLSCFTDALVSNEVKSSLWLEQALEILRAIKDVDGFHFNGVHQSSAIYGLMASESEDVIKVGASPEVKVEQWADFESLLQSRSKNFRKEIRSCRRKLESTGKIGEAMNDRELTPREAVEAVLAFKRDWVRDRGLRSKSILSREGEAFLSEFCEQLELRDGPGELRVNSVRIDDRLIACGIAFEYFGQHLEYIGGFEHQQREQGAGKVQLASSIAYAAESGCQSCNLLTPSTEFKSRWTDDHPVVVQIFRPLSFKGRIYRDLYLKRLRPGAKRLYHFTKPVVEKWLRKA